MSYLSDKLLVTGYLMLLLSGTVNATDKTATTEASVDSDVAPLLDVYKRQHLLRLYQKNLQ